MWGTWKGTRTSDGNVKRRRVEVGSCRGDDWRSWQNTYVKTDSHLEMQGEFGRGVGTTLGPPLRVESGVPGVNGFSEG